MLIYNKDPNKYVVPGFRQGKAPLSSVLKTYGNDVFLNDAVEMYLSLKIKELGIENTDNITYSLLGIDNYGCVPIKLFIK
jgi:FKBP-type peptidyl-prolyl cis-trans isomerase (trigger factor)